MQISLPKAQLHYRAILAIFLSKNKSIKQTFVSMGLVTVYLILHIKLSPRNDFSFKPAVSQSLIKVVRPYFLQSQVTKTYIPYIYHLIIGPSFYFSHVLYKILRILFFVLSCSLQFHASRNAFKAKSTVTNSLPLSKLCRMFPPNQVNVTLTVCI